MTSGWRCWGCSVGAAVVTLLLSASAWWWLQPKTPEQLYLSRCTACHALADLSGYRREDLAALVQTMRVRNGADQVISDEEAQQIIHYLETRP